MIGWGVGVGISSIMKNTSSSPAIGAAPTRRPWFVDLEDAERRGARGSAGIGYFDCDCDLCRRPGLRY